MHARQCANAQSPLRAAAPTSFVTSATLTTPLWRRSVEPSVDLWKRVDGGTYYPAQTREPVHDARCPPPRRGCTLHVRSSRSSLRRPVSWRADVRATAQKRASSGAYAAVRRCTTSPARQSSALIRYTTRTRYGREHDTRISPQQRASHRISPR
jgi:hypothetical protein